MTTFYDAILKWVGKNYGTQEMEDPSWSVKDLADYLGNQDINPDELNAMTKLECYRAIERSYLREDCDMVADGMSVELTDKERDVVIDEFMNSDAYVDAHAEDWQYFIKQELKHREEK